jgi:hypothetical protein
MEDDLSDLSIDWRITLNPSNHLKRRYELDSSGSG